jgi:hypothetical protein
MITAFKAYEKTYDRARYLIRLAFGLTNHRQKRIRCDWRKSFCIFMKDWPRNSAIERVDSKDALVVLREGSYLKPKNFSIKEISELYRAAIVLLVSAIDTYFHSKILEVFDHMNIRKPPEKLLNWEFRKSLRDFIDLKNNKDSKRRFLKILVGEKIEYQTFQKPDKISEALKHIGVEEFWDKIAKELNRSANDVKTDMDRIVRRRDMIVHEGDIITTQGKYQGHSRKIEHSKVYKSCEFIHKFIEASDKVIDETNWLDKGGQKSRSDLNN